jgi:hypothetical protein
MPNADEQAQGKTKHTSGGRVEVSLLKNDLEQLASSNGQPAAPATTQQQQAPPQ